MSSVAGKKILFLMRKAPHGTIYSYEGLETLLIFASFEQEVTMLFLDDGVFALLKDQDTTEIGIKGFIKTYRALEDYGVEKILVDRESMETRGVKKEDFAIDVELIDSSEIAAIFKEHDATINY